MKTRCVLCRKKKIRNTGGGGSVQLPQQQPSAAATVNQFTSEMIAFQDALNRSQAEQQRQLEATFGVKVGVPRNIDGSLKQPSVWRHLWNAGKALFGFNTAQYVPPPCLPGQVWAAPIGPTNASTIIADNVEDDIIFDEAVTDSAVPPAAEFFDPYEMLADTQGRPLANHDGVELMTMLLGGTT